MGGYLRVVIRDEDGTVWSNQRHTNALGTFTRDARFVDNDEAWFQRYKGNGQFHSDDHTLAPIDYGIVVIDRASRTVIDCNDYGRPLALSIVTLRSSEGDPDYQALLERGMLSLNGETLVLDEGETLAQRAQRLYVQDEWAELDIGVGIWKSIRVLDGHYHVVRDLMKEAGFEFTPRDEAAFDNAIRNRMEDGQVDVDDVLRPIAKTPVDVARDAASHAAPAGQPEANDGGTGLRTYTIDVWHEESIWTWEGVASSVEEAEQAAVEGLNQDWERDYANMAEMRMDVDGVAIIPHPAVMAEREPLARVEARKRLAERIREMLDGGVLGDLGAIERGEIQGLVDAALAD